MQQRKQARQPSLDVVLMAVPRFLVMVVERTIHEASIHEASRRMAP